MTNTSAQHIVKLAEKRIDGPNIEEIPKIKEIAKDSGFIVTGDKEEINWFHTLMLTGIPAVALYGMFTTKLTIPTAILALLMYFWTGMGITGGYHRLWSHRAYQAKWIVRFLLCYGGAAAFEGSAKWWCRNHRAHHRYTDTERDPYNAKRGFFYSHLGWMLVKQNAKKIGYADITDLQRDPMIQFQHQHYLTISLSIGVLLPVLIGMLWGDARGAFFYAVALRVFFVHHATFFVNSLAHSLGDKTYSDLHTAFDSFITAVLTLGEGYHNYHHEFPADYRNGIQFYHYDPTKWLIRGLSFFGLAYNLKSMSEAEIEKAKLQMKYRNLHQEQAKLQFGKDFTDLPVLSMTEFHNRVANGDQLIIIAGTIHDVSHFVHDHPGGRQTLLHHVGSDATEFFEGKKGYQNAEKYQLHPHSKEARAYLHAMRVAKVEC